ncbi:MAG: DUF2252 domain-containing protein, partial [Micrococcaceae bacterium]|nr:DUF2252 domain-containing protein [Micrococcaceae bacterium]
MSESPMVLPLSRAERRAAGRKRRSEVPRRCLAELSSAARDPLGIIDGQNSTRIPELVPLRTERMSQSPFAFYRGTAAIMAADLAGEPNSGILVPSCGDAHVANFGFYSSPQRTLVFDLNDFDEAAWAPWEWDLKRLIASIVIAGQSTERDGKVVREAVLTATKSYAFAMRMAAKASPLRRYYAHFEAAAGTGRMHPESRKVLDRAIGQAKKRTGERASRKLTQQDDGGRLRFVPRPPTMVPLAPELHALQVELMNRYLRTVHPDIRMLMGHYRAVDVIRRVVGVGSVGTRCALSLFQDGDGNSLVLQSKQAGRSVLEEYGGIEQPAELAELAADRGQGGRVVAMQRILQAVSDPFLGSLQHGDGQLGELDLYVRQFHDMKGGIDIEELDDEPFTTYARACAVTLARAHAQSPHAAEVSGYLGDGATAGDALLNWGLAYAQRSHRDYEAFISRPR